MYQENLEIDNFLGKKNKTILCQQCIGFLIWFIHVYMYCIFNYKNVPELRLAFVKVFLYFNEYLVVV